MHSSSYYVNLPIIVLKFLSRFMDYTHTHTYMQVLTIMIFDTTFNYILVLDNSFLWITYDFGSKKYDQMVSIPNIVPHALIEPRIWIQANHFFKKKLWSWFWKLGSIPCNLDWTWRLTIGLPLIQVHFLKNSKIPILVLKKLVLTLISFPKIKLTSSSIFTNHNQNQVF